jgi:hypothetical protein
LRGLWRRFHEGTLQPTRPGRKVALGPCWNQATIMLVPMPIFQPGSVLSAPMMRFGNFPEFRTLDSDKHLKPCALTLASGNLNMQQVRTVRIDATRVGNAKVT